MTKEANDLGSVDSRVMRELERAIHLTPPSFELFSSKMIYALEHFRQQQEDLQQIAQRSVLALDAMTKLSASSERLMQLAEDLSPLKKAALEAAQVHLSWMVSPSGAAAKRAIAKAIAGGESWGKSLILQEWQDRQAMQSLAVAEAIRGQTLASRLCSAIDVEAFRKSLLPTEDQINAFARVTSSMLTSYDSLTRSFSTPTVLTMLPSFVLPGATREIVTAGVAHRSISPEVEHAPVSDEAEVVEEYQEKFDGIEGLLADIEPGLIVPYRGSKEALQRSGTDKARHVLVSLRELWNYVLRRLAPEKEVGLWIPNDEPDLLHDGKPTRRAKILYICRGISHQPLSEFVDTDTKSLLDLIELLNRVHSLTNTLTERQLRALVLRTDSWLLYILQITKETA